MERTHYENSASVQTWSRPATYVTCSELNADDHHYASFSVESASVKQKEIKMACCVSRFSKCALTVGLVCVIIVGVFVGLLTYAVLMAGNAASNIESYKHSVTLLNKTNLQLQEALDNQDGQASNQSQYIIGQLGSQISALSEAMERIKLEASNNSAMIVNLQKQDTQQSSQLYDMRQLIDSITNDPGLSPLIFPWFFSHRLKIGDGHMVEEGVPVPLYAI